MPLRHALRPPHHRNCWQRCVYSERSFRTPLQTHLSETRTKWLGLMTCGRSMNVIWMSITTTASPASAACLLMGSICTTASGSACTTPDRRWRFALLPSVSWQRAVSVTRLLAAQGADGYRHRRRRGYHLQHAAHAGEAYKVGQLQSYRLRASEAFYHATLGGAHALRLDDKIGNFVPGKEADFIVIDPAVTRCSACVASAARISTSNCLC